jgi:hypothetical protein
MTKIEFDLDKSLEMCPPKYLYAQGPNGEKWHGEDGTRFKKRHMMRRDKVMFLKDDQTKVEVNTISNVRDITESFQSQGWDHSERPLVYWNSKDGEKGDEGYHRNAAAEELGWETLPFDQIEYFSPLDQQVSKHNSNNGTPRKKNRLKDTVKAVKTCVDKGLVTADKIKDPNDLQLKALIVRLTPGKVEKTRKTILRKYRSIDSGYATLVTWDAEKINKYCSELKLPFAGEKNFENTGKVGYAKPQGTMKSLMHDCMGLIVGDNVPRDENGKYIPIEIRAFIDDPNPDPKVLKRQREKWLDSFKKNVISFIKEFYQLTTGQTFNYKLPLVFKGFVYQNVTSNPENDGHPMEQEFILEQWMLDRLK